MATYGEKSIERNGRRYSRPARRPRNSSRSRSLPLSLSRSLSLPRCRGTRMNIYRSPRLRSIGRLSDKKTSSNSNRGSLPSPIIPALFYSNLFLLSSFFFPFFLNHYTDYRRGKILLINFEDRSNIYIYNFDEMKI